MAQNYVLLETIELSQSAASVTFDNIPQTGYTDLKIVVSARSTASGGQNINVTFNATSSGYDDKILGGSGTGVTAGNSGNTTKGSSVVTPGSDFTTNTFGNGEIYIPNYRVSPLSKFFMTESTSENNAALSYYQLHSTSWSGTGAITSILMDLSSGSFAAGSTFSLYGIAALNTTPVTAPFASGGNIVANDGTYWYHAFLNSGTFTPAKALTCDYLVVAGGGGGGGSNTNGVGVGGGGAGGLRSTVTSTGGLGSLETALSVTAQAYAITVGAGGAGGFSSGTNGFAGSNSVFSTITSTGGGYGAFQAIGGTGGSGGGGSYTGGAGPRTASPVQGFAGGAGSTYNNANYYPAGGGGGAGAAGQAGSTNSTQAGNGGAGVAISAFATPTGTGVSNYYAGGGGGSLIGAFGTQTTGGAGGGGAGGRAVEPNGGAGTAGTANTGGGGGAGGPSAGGSGPISGAAGGSGIVIVRYPMV